MLRQAVAKLQIKHDKPELWSPRGPHLYRVVTRVLQGGQVLDELTTPCGFAPSTLMPTGASSSTASRSRSRAFASTRTMPVWAWRCRRP